MPTIVLGVLGSFYYSANILPVSPPKRIFSKIKNIGGGKKKEFFFFPKTLK